GGGEVGLGGKAASAGGVLQARQFTRGVVERGVRVGRRGVGPGVRVGIGRTHRGRRGGPRRCRGRVGGGCRGGHAPLLSRGCSRGREGRIPAPFSALNRAI